ncbi:MAG: hypothetical protein Tsb009_39140 [Planctomycetaceae bacterium]
MTDLICSKTFLIDSELGELVPIEDFNGSVVNPLYPEGSIQLDIRGKRFLYKKEVLDTVEGTWFDLVITSEAIMRDEPSTSCPDPELREILFVTTPMPAGFVEFKRVGPDPQRVVVPKVKFIHGILTEVYAVYEELIRILPPRYRGELPQSDARENQQRIKEYLEELENK